MKRSEGDRALHRWATHHNLGIIVRFHHDVREMLQKGHEGSESLDPREAVANADLYLQLHSANSLLMAYAFFEEFLWLTWRRELPGDVIPEGSSIDRYKRVLHEIGMHLGTSESWGRVRDVAAIRNCLLHANGRLSLLRDPQRVRSCLQSRPGLSERHDRVIVGKEFLLFSVNAIEQLRRDILDTCERKTV